MSFHQPGGECSQGIGCGVMKLIVFHGGIRTLRNAKSMRLDGAEILLQAKFWFGIMTHVNLRLKRIWKDEVE